MYNENLAPAVLLRGGTRGSQIPAIDPEHYFATLPQRNPCAFGIRPTWGTYGVEEWIAYKGLRNAGISATTATRIVIYADAYFFGVLGVTRQSDTRRPGDRRTAC